MKILIFLTLPLSPLWSRCIYTPHPNPKLISKIMDNIAADAAAALDATVPEKPALQVGDSLEKPAPAVVLATDDTERVCSKCGIEEEKAPMVDPKVYFSDHCLHCDTCANLVCGECDPLKKICPCQSTRDECGMVRCGDCSNKTGAIPWVKCKSCKRFVCTSCSDAGTTEAMDHGMPQELAPICLECCDMAMEEMGCGDY